MQLLLQCCYKVLQYDLIDDVVSATMHSYCDVDNAEMKLLVRRRLCYSTASNATTSLMLLCVSCYIDASAMLQLLLRYPNVSKRSLYKRLLLMLVATMMLLVMFLA